MLLPRNGLVHIHGVKVTCTRNPSASHTHKDNKGAISRTEGARSVLFDIARRLKHVPPFRSGWHLLTQRASGSAA